MGAEIRIGLRVDDGHKVAKGHIGVVQMEPPSGAREGGESRGVTERPNHQHTGPIALNAASRVLTIQLDPWCCRGRSIGCEDSLRCAPRYLLSWELDSIQGLECPGAS